MIQSHIMSVLPRRLIANLWASQETRISLSHLAVASKQKINYQQHDVPIATSPSFLCSELPIRYTHILRLLSSLNSDSLQNPVIRNVAHRYLSDICTMLHPSLRQTSPRAFSNTIRKLRQRQASTLIRLRYALASSSTATSHSIIVMDQINAVSLGIHFLLDQHVSWHRQTGNQAQVICPIDIAHQAVTDARSMCADTFGESNVPQVSIKKSGSHPLEVIHVPHMLHRILYETTLLGLRSHYTQPHPQEKTWWQRLFPSRKQPALQLDVFGGPTSIGFRLNNSAMLSHHDLQHDIPRDPMGVPTCASVLRQASHSEEQEEEENMEWFMLSGWRMAKTMACHFGGNLDVVSAEGLGSTMYLALDRDSQLLERYPSHHHQRSTHLSLQRATSQLDAFLYAIADPNTSFQYTSPATHHHAVSLTAAVGHA
ncbi:uncharacterized protein BX664DRAFT_381445 [Halteromyces radiatus]|uniref:uncharacterized protein n=1 Tax=Halteromyces radiatus TaxID=101107 RepID=UPI00221E48FB|nr:uncharacterized protein BX664DRAFT_381445 [Halteromyces radiatus]KAI8098775.1 hypothetical protein BX664DRAFT_381445 [Halteromyces radiatus]